MGVPVFMFAQCLWVRGIYRCRKACDLPKREDIVAEELVDRLKRVALGRHVRLAEGQMVGVSADVLDVIGTDMSAVFRGAQSL